VVVQRVVVVWVRGVGEGVAARVVRGFVLAREEWVAVGAAVFVFAVGVFVVVVEVLDGDGRDADSLGVGGERRVVACYEAGHDLWVVGREG
jgi:hypothetical protein